MVGVSVMAIFGLQPKTSIFAFRKQSAGSAERPGGLPIALRRIGGTPVPAFGQAPQ